MEFQVRRASSDVPSSITLDHGDILVMDGLAQSEDVHRTLSGLQGPRVNLTYRWVTRHTASCPLAGVVGCVLPSCVQGSAEPESRDLGLGENKWISFWGTGLPFVNPCVFPLTIGRGIVTVVSSTSPCGFVPVGLGDGVGQKEGLFISPLVFSGAGCA